MTRTALPDWLAVVLVAGTSAAVLVLEILAGRLLAPYVGVSLDTYTGIIGTILAGIALGAWAGGAAADRVDPRRMIPVLLVLGGAFAIATIPVVRIVGESTGNGAGPRILLLAAFGFLPAATVLSAVPPAVVKLQLQDLAATGSTVGRLSAWSTGGAIFGTFFTGFVLVAAAAVSTLIVGVGVLLVGSGLLMWLVTRGRHDAVPANELLGISGLAAIALFGVATIDSPCEVQTAYYCLSIEQDAGGRILVLDDLRHSYVDVDDPTRLEFCYVRRLVDVIEVAPAADDIVYLGAGALTIPRYISATAPGTAQTVLEIDPDLIDVVERRIGPEPIDIRIGDARRTLVDRADASADVVIGDAFGSRSVPFHLATEEFITDVERVLRPHGIYAANIIDGPRLRFLAAEAATMARVFDHVVVMLGESAALGGRGNSVIVASNAPIDAALLDQLRIDAGDGGELVTDLDAFVAGQRTLTDDFAPVDQLIALGR
jgi:spermidine synthase